MICSDFYKIRFFFKHSTILAEKSWMGKGMSCVGGRWIIPRGSGLLWGLNFMSFGISLDVPSFSHSIWASDSQSSSNQMHLPEGGLPVVQCGPQTHYIWRKWGKKKKTPTQPYFGTHLHSPEGSPPASKQFCEKLGYLSLAIYHAASTRLQDMRAI